VSLAPLIDCEAAPTQVPVSQQILREFEKKSEKLIRDFRVEIGERYPVAPRADIWIHRPRERRLSGDELAERSSLKDISANFALFRSRVPEYTAERAGSSVNS